MSFVVEPPNLVILSQDGEFVLYRGQTSLQPCAPTFLLLAPASARPAPETLKKIEHEHSLRDELDSAWAVRPVALSQQAGQMALELEDPGGETLDRLLSSPLEIRLFLRLAVSIAGALAGLHKRGLIHKDVKPSHILVNPANDEVRLMGFGIASLLPRERQTPEPPEFIAGTLPYMAPEQTGRMNRSIDSRSDLYAFGVTLYEMLTGSLPFSATDPLELVHCHIARQPVPPADLVTRIPRLLSVIVMKLLAKGVEERYQTAAGAERDLRRCLDEWESRGGIDEFPLGEKDIPDRLLIPEKLYGREAEIAALLAAFDRVKTGGRPELVLISGYSGVGKSSVVNELHKRFVPSRGLFASGKFDRYQRDVPYATLAPAFQSLLRSLLTRSEADLAKWRNTLRETLEPNGQLIVDLVPELKLIIGEQPPVPPLPLQDEQRRFHLVFRRFISVFARQEHPLTLFLDDLQWLDPATLDLLKHLLTRTDLQHLLLIGAYRDNEVGPNHPLMQTLNMIRDAGALVHDIELAPLNRENVAQLIADSLRCEPEHVAPLADLVHQKTAGNPFFATHFISAVADEGLLAFNQTATRWVWDLNRIRSKGDTENVADLLIGKMNRLAPGTQEALRHLACFGNSIDFTLLGVIFQDSVADMHAQLWEAVRSGFIFRSEDSYRFVHDRVREAAYSSTSEDFREQAHLKIGRLLATNIASDRMEERIFDVVNHLDCASHLITSAEERDRVAELNLIAARRAKTSVAYPAAIKYLAAGRTMLSEESWGKRYRLIFAIEYLTAECELLTADMEAAEKRLSMLASRANSDHDLAVVTRLQLTLYTALDRLDRGVEICLEYLRRDGGNWSPHPTGNDIGREYDRIWSLLGDRQIEDLINLPVVANPDVLDVLEVLTELITPAVFFDRDLCALAICRIVNLSLEHGHSDASCFAYVWFGIIAGPRFGNYKDSFRFARLGYDLLGKRGLKRYEARTCMCFAVAVPWTTHARHGRELARHAFGVAYKVGDFTYALYSLLQVVTNCLFEGNALAETQVEAERTVVLATSARVGLVVDIAGSDLQLIRTLRGSTNTFGSFNDKEFDEDRFERHLAGNPALAIAACGYWTLKAQARFFAGDYTSAVEASLQAQEQLWAAPALLELAAFRFYGALSHAAAWDSASSDEKQKHSEALTAHHKELEIWAEHCPENFEDRAALVGAEIARIDGRLIDAEQLYQKAIRSAHANGFIQDEAVAYEVAARFYAARGLDTVADTFLREARYCYLRWGAAGKVRHLDQLYPRIKSQETAHSATSSVLVPAELLDLATVIKISQTVSGEMVLEKLIDKVMRAAIEHAGAERGLLIHPSSSELRLEAEALATGCNITVHLRPVMPVALPESLIRYVLRTREDVILDDAAAESPFAADDYVVQRRARSIVCLPLVNQSRLNGIIYLENNLTTHVFNSERITVLKVLASHAAIALENSRLYGDVEDREARLRRLFDSNIMALVNWNLKGAITAANDAFLHMSQYSPEDVASGRVTWRAMTPTEWNESDERAVMKLRQTGSVEPYEKEWFRKDGSRVPVLVAGVVFEGSDEGIGFAIDLSAQKRAEAEIRALKDQLYKENLALRDEVDRASMFEEIIGTSTPLKAVLSRIAKVAPTDSTILITGETGTGKELVARAVHKRSPRSGRAFVSVNCAALAPSLISSELFGHEKGAFTGATQKRLGRFELADGGTIFLDEVGELLPDTQVALLRVLQEREFERVGGVEPIHVDVRVIAATNRDLKAAIASGAFRQDLSYRLNVFPIEVPPLRERKEDLLMLIEYFVQRYARRIGKDIRSIDKKTLDRLQSYDWPGNIRELQNVIERSVILSSGDVFSVDELWLSTEISRPAPGLAAVAEGINSEGEPWNERETIEVALAESRGRVSGTTGAAAKLGIPPSTLDHRIKILKINKRRFKLMG